MSAQKKVALCTPVPSSGVEHVRSQGVFRNADNVLEISGEDNSFVTEAHRGEFGDERIAYRPNCCIIRKCACEKHGFNSPLSCGISSSSDGGEANDYKQDDYNELIIKIKRSAAEFVIKNQEDMVEIASRTY